MVKSVQCWHHPVQFSSNNVLAISQAFPNKQAKGLGETRHSQGQFSSGQMKPAQRGLILGCNTGQIEQRIVISRCWSTIWSGYRLDLCSYGDLGIRKKQSNISVDSTENNEAHYNCSKHYKSLHTLLGMKTINFLVSWKYKVYLQWSGLVTGGVFGDLEKLTRLHLKYCNDDKAPMKPLATPWWRKKGTF